MVPPEVVKKRLPSDKVLEEISSRASQEVRGFIDAASSIESYVIVIVLIDIVFVPGFV